MLKVKGGLIVSDGSLCLDGYVPISFRCDSVKSSSPSVWWRTGNFRTSLIEIGVSNYNGAIYDLTAVLLPDVSSTATPNGHLLEENVETIEQLPLVDTAGFENLEKNVYIDEPYHLVSYLFQDSLFVWFGEITSVSRFYKIDRLSIGTNSRNEICLIKAEDLSSSEIDNILAIRENNSAP